VPTLLYKGRTGRACRRRRKGLPGRGYSAIVYRWSGICLTLLFSPLRPHGADARAAMPRWRRKRVGTVLRGAKLPLDSSLRSNYLIGDPKPLLLSTPYRLVGYMSLTGRGSLAGNVIIAVLYLGVSGLIPVYSRIWVYSWRTKIPEMPTGFRAQVFGLGRKAPWLDHLPKPYWRRHIAGTMRIPIPCRTPTRNTSWRDPIS